MTFRSAYHPLLVFMHWFVAALMAAMLYVAYTKLSAPGLDPETLPLLRAHMAGGMLLLALTVVRLVVRLWTTRGTQGRAAPALKRRPAHLALYVLVMLTIVVGFANSVTAGLPEIVFGGSGAALPIDFHNRLGSTLHRWLAWALTSLIIMHAAKAFRSRVRLPRFLTARV
jgi:cytochrome b561